MPAATMYAVLTAVAMIGWNAVVTERKKECPGRPYCRHRRSRRRFRRPGRGHRHRHEKPAQTEQLSSLSPSSPTTTTTRATTKTDTFTPSRQLQRHQQQKQQQQGEPSRCGAVAACRPCGTPVTAPASADRCPVSPATAATPPSPPRPAVEFEELVLILDAPAMPPAPWKLPNLPEEIDASWTDDLTDPSTSLSPPSPSTEVVCDLSPGFHLSAPWSPLGRRNSWGRTGGGNGNSSRNRRRSVPLGNRPRTFSEYSAAESAESGSGQVSAPLPRERPTRSASAGAGAGLWSATVTAAAAWGDWRERRARSFACGSLAASGGGGGDRGPFADWSVDKHDAEEFSRGGNGGGHGGVRRRNGGVMTGGIRGVTGGVYGNCGSDEDDEDRDVDGGGRWCPEESLVLLRNMSIARKGIAVGKGRASVAAATCGVAAGNLVAEDDRTFRTGHGNSSSSSSSSSSDRSVSNSSSSSGGGGDLDDSIGRMRRPLGAGSRHSTSRILQAW